MKKRSITSSANLRILLVLMLITSFGIISPSKVSGQTNNELTPYNAVDEMPTYPGGDAALLKFIVSKINYPARIQEQGIQGKIIVKFCVTAQGSISQVSVLKGLDPDLDKEAMRVVRMIPNFNPGKKSGVPVPVWYMVPITFSIKTTN